MRVLLTCVALLALWMLASTVLAQQADQNSQTATTVCDFDDGREISVQYSKAQVEKNEPRNGKVWEPGGTAMTLYTQTPVLFNNIEIPVGAFSMYVIPNHKEWTLILNRNVTAPAKYDQTQDMARGSMEVGDLSQPVKPLQVVMAHMGPKVCSIRLYYDTVGALTQFTEK